MVGRQHVQSRIREKLSFGAPEFIAMYGRRRVGKTYFIQDFFKDDLCFQMTGIHEEETEKHLKEFAKALAKTVGTPIPGAPPESWQDAFTQLENVLANIRPKKNRRRVIFFDELPWLDTHRSGFLAALGQFWNTWASQHKDVVLIVCGSAASWMIRKLLHNRGGLHNRVTLRIRLEPFCLAETEAFLQSRKVKLERKQIAEIAMVTGGIPFYLEAVEKGMSSMQVIDALCFRKEGLLRDEFSKLYPALFAHEENHIAVVRALAKKNRGLTRNEISQASKIPSGGGLTKVLDELEESGFIEASTQFGLSLKDRHYRLIDEYSIFYLRWIEPARSKTLSYENLQDSPKWRAWSGYAFESLCRRHIPQIKEALKIAAVQTEQSTWTYRPKKGEEEAGAQIDLLIDRRDETINLCEMKFSRAPFVIDKKYAAQLHERKETFRRITGTKKSLFHTLITPQGVKENAHALDVVQSQVTLDALFAPKERQK